MNKWMGTIGAMAMLAACGDGGAPTEEGAKGGGIDLSAFDEGKGDMGKKAKLLDELAPDSQVTGKFDPRVRVYGYVVEASKGATLDVSLSALAGADASWLSEGEELDTILAVYGPYKDRRNPGALLAETDDSDDSFAAPPINLEIEEDGKYLIAFTSWDDTGTGDYDLNIGCEGTDFQCRRPQFEKPCETGQLFVQGTMKFDTDTTWDRCEVILLETATIDPGVILTIRPGVEVKSNFLNGGAAGDFGQVALDVHGTLQAVGTAKNPIRFTSLTPNGWAGLRLRGESNAVQHAYIENARSGVEIFTGATAEISDVVIDGLLRKPDGSQRQGDVGVRAHSNASAVFTRAAVKNFAQAGLETLQGDHVLIEDSVIHDNGVGVLIQGESAVTSCPSRAHTPRVWRDPVIRRTDIYKNGRGIQLRGSDALLQIEFSNIVDNTNEALLIHGSNLNPESFIRNSNILRNASGGIQVRSVHREGTLDISSNYWEDISDPELSANWNSRCGGQLSFTGFHPLPVDTSGPKVDVLVDDVKQETLFAQQQAPPTDGDND